MATVPSACVEQLRQGSYARTTADTRLSMPSCSCVAVDETAAHLIDAAIDRQVVVPRGDDQVGPTDRALLVHLVVMDQSAARRFDHAHAFQRSSRTRAPGRVVSRIRGSFEQQLDLLQRVDQSRSAARSDSGTSLCTTRP